MAFQDMKKAFDSVSLKMLRLAICRIKFPEHIISFIIELFDKWKIEEITGVGNIAKFQAMDGIDQGEVISLLVWQIFYNPLLIVIQDREDLGYKIQVDWPTDICKLM